MALTRITKGVIKPNENYDTHNINSTGIVTAIGLDVNGNGDISGNLSVGGVLTYEDVTSIDSVGIITARNGIDCNGDIDVDGHTNLDNVSIAGIVTVAGSTDLNGDLDVDGHTNLDNVSVAGVTTFSDSDIFFKNSGITSCKFRSDLGRFQLNNSGGLQWFKNGNLSSSSGAMIYYSEGAVPNGYGGLVIQAPWTGQSNAKHIKVMGSSNGYFDIQNNLNGQRIFTANFEGGVDLRYYQQGIKLQTTATGVTANQNLTVNKDLDVDGHTNLDNVSVAGVTTFAGDIETSKNIVLGDGSDGNASINRLKFGASGDLQIYHNQYHSKIVDGGTGALIISGSEVRFETEPSSTETLRITGIGSIGVGGGSEVERKVDIVTSNGNSVVIRPNADAANSAGNANVVNNLIILRMPYGQNAGSSNNAGARIGVQFTGRNDGAGYVDDPSKSASVYGVSEDSSGGYARKMGLAFYTSAHDTSQTERLRITSNGRVSINDGTRSADSATEGATLRVSGTPVTRNEYFSPHGHYFGSIGYTTDTHTKAWLAVDSHYAQSSAVSAGIFLSAFHQDAGGSDCGYTIKNLKTGNALVFSRVKTAASTGNPAVEEERVRIHADGKVTFGASSTAKATVDIIQSGQSATSLSLLVGANESGGSPTTRTNSFQKAARIACPHYTNAEEPMNIVVAYSGSSTNNLYWGGGTGVMNAATQHDFYTAANNTTTNGTVRLRIDNLGKITHFANAGDNQYISKRTGSAGSNGDYFFQLFALNSGDTTVGGIGIHRDTATDDSRMVFSTRNSGGSNQERLRIKSDGSTFLQTSNVNINRGTNGAGYPLTVRGPSSGDIIRLERANSGQWHFGFDGNTNFTVKSNTTEVVRITTAGHIQLQGGIIYGDDNASNVLKLQSTSGNVNHSRIEIGASQSSDNGGIHFYTAGSSAATRHMTLKGTSGNLGIGIDNPVQKVHLYNASNDPYVRIQRGTTSNVDVGGIEFTSANTVFATMGSRVTSHSGGRGAVYIQTQEGSGTTREPLRVVANSGGFGERLISQGSGVCLFGTNGTHGNQFKDGRPELNNVYEESQSAYRSSNGAAGGTFVVTGTGSNAATTYYPVAFTLHQQFPCVLTINKYVHNYATWDGTLMFRADMSGTGYGGHVALHRVTMNIQSGKQFIGRIKFTTHNNAYLVLWMLGGGRSYHWGTIGSGVQVIRVYDDGGSYNLGPGNSSEGPITSPDTIDTGYEPNMNDSPSHQQTGFS